MKLYYVYILECSDKLLYPGITNNISRRLKEHNEGLDKNSFTFKRRHVEVIFIRNLMMLIRPSGLKGKSKDGVLKRKGLWPTKTKNY